jgi:hypothetical protein
MRYVLVAAVLVFLLAGCGKTYDPRLCEKCLAIAKAQDVTGPEGPELRKKLIEERESTWDALVNVDLLQGRHPYVDCPECDKARNRAVARERAWSKN